MHTPTPVQLTALGEAVGTVSRGLPQAAIDALPTAQYYEVAGTAGAEGAEAEEQCPICRCVAGWEGAGWAAKVPRYGSG